MSSLGSEVKVANLALTGLGADRIMSLTEDSENARRVNAIFDLFRDSLLRKHTWNFAIERRDFGAALSNSPEYGFDNYFQIPGDVLRIIEPETSDIKFKREGDKIATDEGSFKCLCLIRITDVAKWSEDFVTVFAAKLEAELAYAITRSRTVAADKAAVFAVKWRETTGTDAQEGTPLPYEIDEWFDARETGATFQPKLAE